MTCFTRRCSEFMNRTMIGSSLAEWIARSSRWKTPKARVNGPLTQSWVPYSQVSHVPALTDYLDLQGVDRVADLRDGWGTPPDDPHVFLGMMGLEGYICGPQALMAHRNPRSLHANLTRNKFGDLMLRDPVTRLPFTFTATQARAFCRFDSLLRRESGSVNGMQYYPGGYDTFVDLWNTDPSSPFGFATFNPKDGTCTLSPRPAVSEDILAPLPAPRIIKSGLDLPPSGMQTVIRSLTESQTRSYEARDRIGVKRGGMPAGISDLAPVEPSATPTPIPIPAPSIPGTATLPPGILTPTPVDNSTQNMPSVRNLDVPKEPFSVDKDGLIIYDSGEGADGEADGDTTMVENKAV